MKILDQSVQQCFPYCLSTRAEDIRQQSVQCRTVLPPMLLLAADWLRIGLFRRAFRADNRSVTSDKRPSSRLLAQTTLHKNNQASAKFGGATSVRQHAHCGKDLLLGSGAQSASRFIPGLFSQAFNIQTRHEVPRRCCALSKRHPLGAVKWSLHMSLQGYQRQSFADHNLTLSNSDA